MIHIEELRKLENQLEKDLQDNREQQCKINKENWLKERGLKIGDLITYTISTGGSKKQNLGVLKVLSFDFNNEVSHPYVALIGKNGKEGKKLTRIWNSEQDSIKKAN